MLIVILLKSKTRLLSTRFHTRLFNSEMLVPVESHQESVQKSYTIKSGSVKTDFIKFIFK